MKKSHKILIGSGIAAIALVATAAIAGPLVYRAIVAPQADETPSLSAESNVLEGKAAGEPLDPADLAGVWLIAEGSEAGYRVDEVLNGTDVTVTGRTSGVTGSFTISDDGLTLEGAEITVDVATIETDNPSRDRYFREEALRADEFPTAVFTLTQPVTLAEVPDSGSTATSEATGDLTIAGETRSVTATVEVRSDGTMAEIAGTIPIVFEDFGVTAPNLGFVSVEPAGSVEFSLNATR